LLSDLEQGRAAAAEELLPLVYDELRALAGSILRGSRKDHTLQPTALVHEAFAKMVGAANRAEAPERRWSSRAHFFAVAAKAMRQVLANYARDRNAAKRGGGDWRRVTLRDAVAATPAFDVDLLALNDAMEKLTEFDARQCKVVELRFFAEMTTEEIAHVLDISPSTVEREWRMARAWLSAELAGAAGGVHP